MLGTVDNALARLVLRQARDEARGPVRVAIDAALAAQGLRTRPDDGPEASR